MLALKGQVSGLSLFAVANFVEDWKSYGFGDGISFCLEPELVFEPVIVVHFADRYQSSPDQTKLSELGLISQEHNRNGLCETQLH